MEKNLSPLSLPTIGSLVTVQNDGRLLQGVVTNHYSKDCKPVFIYQHDHVMPDGSIVKSDKWAWLDQLIDINNATGFVPERKMKTLQELYQLWDRLGNVPLNRNDTIEVKFLDFEKGTPREDVWHWFESQNSNFVIGEIQSGMRRTDEPPLMEQPQG